MDDQAVSGDDTVSGAETAEVLPTVTPDHIESLGLDPEKVAADDPAITGVPRDERHDSIDPQNGGLTAEAVALRQERAAAETE